jgi:dihydroorotate dehydrogenase
MELRDRVNKNLPILIKIAPDLNDEDLKDIAKVSMRKDVFIVYFGYLKMFIKCSTS